MPRRSIPMSVAAGLLVLIAIPHMAFSQWIDDGALFRSSTSSVSHQSIVPDTDQGGYFVQIVHTLTEAIETKHFDSHGNILWTQVMPWPVGVSTMSNPVAAADGSGGVIVAFVGNNGSLNSLYVNRYDDSGALLYGQGVQCSGTTPVFTPAIDTDADGTVYLAWNTVSASGGYVYCQKIHSTGHIVWNTNGVRASDWATVTNDAKVVADGTGGLYTTWTDNRAGNVDIYGQRINASSTLVWGTSALAVCSNVYTQSYPILILDDSGGCMFFWIDYRSSTAIYGQQISATGTAEWAAGGVSVASSSASKLGLCGVSDGHGGASVFWREYTSPISVYGQGVDTNGNGFWIMPFGQPVIEGAYNCSSPIAVAYDGGAWVVCSKYVNSQYDLYVQKINWGGGISLNTTGAAVCTAPNDQYTAVIGADGADGALLSWIDWRDGRNDTYAQRLTNVPYAFGYAWQGFPGAGIAGVDDVPGDQGGFVNLTFNASPLDAFPNNPVTSYTLWRTLSPTKAGAGDALMISDPADLRPDMKPPLHLAAVAGDKTVYWELMSVETPYAQPGYARVLPTPYDSTAVYSEPVVYRIMTHTSDPATYWTASTARGLSVDNLAPATPLGLAGAGSYSPAMMTLSWLPNAESDLAGYALYRGPSADFPLDEAHLVVELDGTTHQDPNWTTGDHYRLAALDIHGNVGSAALLTPDAITAVEDDTPGVFAVRPCLPNPFNPSTEIRFEIPVAGAVELQIFDAAGRLVRHLVEGDELAAGRHTRAWDGRNDQGQRGAAGVYFFRVTSGVRTGVGRMVMVK